MQIHDNVVNSYLVDMNKKYIELYTENSEVKDIKVKFIGVFAHYIENQLQNSIILDIIEKDISTFVKDNKEILDSRKNNCWPVDYDKIEELEEQIRCGDYSYYIIQSSYGLRGWIISKGYQIS